MEPAGRLGWEIAVVARSVTQAASSLASDAAQACSEDLLAWLHGRLRHGGTRIFAEVPRPATTAMWTSGRGRIVIGHVKKAPIGQFRGRVERVF